MADKNTSIDVSPAEITSAPPPWTAESETVGYAYLVMMCQAFQDKMMTYYKAGTSPEDKAARLDSIRGALKLISLGGYSIAPNITTGMCPNNEKDVEGVCMNTK